MVEQLKLCSSTTLTTGRWNMFCLWISFSLFINITIFCHFSRIRFGKTEVKYLSHIMSVSGPRNYADPFSQFCGPETDTFCQFLVSIVFFPGILANRKRKNNLNKLWIIYEFNRNKQNPFEHKLI